MHPEADDMLACIIHRRMKYFVMYMTDLQRLILNNNYKNHDFICKELISVFSGSCGWPDFEISRHEMQSDGEYCNNLNKTILEADIKNVGKL